MCSRACAQKMLCEIISALCTNPTAHSFVYWCMTQGTTYSVHRSVYCVHMCSIKWHCAKAYATYCMCKSVYTWLGACWFAWHSAQRALILAVTFPVMHQQTPSSSSPAWLSSRCQTFQTCQDKQLIFVKINLLQSQSHRGRNCRIN